MLTKTKKKMKASRLATNSKTHDSNGTSVMDSLLQWLEEYIETNQIQIGDALPSEDFIVNETQISRTSVRETFTRLKAFGVIDSRRKRGMRLMRSHGLIDLARILGSNQIPDDLVGHVGGFRSALELGMANEIFHRATDEDIKELRLIYEMMVANSGDVFKWHDQDLFFHEKLIRITGNKVAIWLSQLFRPFFASIRPHEPLMTKSTREKHQEIVAALEKRDLGAFQNALMTHHAYKLSFNNY